ncbi:MAG: uroporphyrinogen decarboxylase family protein [Gemmatimonadota bacterium]
MTERDNLLRAVRFERPEYIPMVYHINAACWHHYPPAELEDLMAAHPFLFPEFEPGHRRVELELGADAVRGRRHRDPWGCRRETTEDGIATLVTQPALATWEGFETYRAPDPTATTGVDPVDWDAVAAAFAQARQRGQLRRGGLRHGHTFLALTDIRGYESTMLDMADDEPRLRRLIALIEAFNAEVVRRYVELGAEWMGYADDLGAQRGPMISPAHFRAYLKPSYERLMAPARQAGCIIHMHSDGDIRELVWDLIGSGVQFVNLQDLVNGIDWIRDQLKDKVCIDLDIDRADVTRFGTPAQVDDLIRREVRTLGAREGGLMMIYGLYPGVPLENAAALMGAMERYATHWS